MALETGINPNEGLVFNGEFSNLVENGQVIVLDEPLMIYTQTGIQNDCALVLEPNNGSNEHLNLPHVVFDGNYFQFENLQHGTMQNDYNLHDNFHYMNERQQVDDGLAVLEILCNNKGALEQPEFIDISKLSERNEFDDTHTADVLCISDDDDVVFVREYKEHSSQDEDDDVKIVEHVAENSSPREDKLRRNPVRGVRIKSKKLSREHILEEDFALLDSSDEEKQEEKENKAPKKKLSSPTESLKQWPVNAHERPEYNCETKKIEAFDYTIREIQKKPSNKKPRLETVTIRRKSKKKYFTRKRKPRVVVPKKIPIIELKPLVDSTTELLKDFFINYKQSTDLVKPENLSKKCNAANKLEVFKNQILLYSVVNELGQEEVAKKLGEDSSNKEETKK